MKQKETYVGPYLALGLGVVVLGCSSCVALVGTPEGVRAYGDLQAGTIAEAKASADTTSSYQVTRRIIEREKTKRYLKPNFMSGLFTSKQEGAQ